MSINKISSFNSLYSTYHIDGHSTKSFMQKRQDPLGFAVQVGAGGGYKVLLKVPFDRPRVGGGAQIGALDVSLLSAFNGPAGDRYHRY